MQPTHSGSPKQAMPEALIEHSRQANGLLRTFIDLNIES
jgi:hypothetical protein